MSAFLESQITTYPDLGDKYNDLLDLFNAKKWHQLTIAVTTFVNTPANYRDVNLNVVTLFNSFVSQFDSKCNQLALAKIAATVAASYGEDAASGRTLLETLLEKRGRLGPQASLYLDMTLTLVLLSTGDMGSVKKMIAESKENLVHIEGIEDPSCHAVFYKAAAAYHHAVGPPEAYYANALMYISYANKDEMEDAEKNELAKNLSLAALTGEGVYNFGEVTATPILSSLANTPDSWLMDLMLSFSAGDVNEFNAIMARSANAVKAQPALFERLEFVSEKIKLLALVNMVFERESNDRNLSFAEIQARTQVTADQVEWVVMKALSLGLIKGDIDQIDATVSVSWVMPRVLSKEQTQALAQRLGEWGSKVSEVTAYMKDQTAELVAC